MRDQRLIVQLVCLIISVSFISNIVIAEDDEANYEIDQKLSYYNNMYPGVVTDVTWSFDSSEIITSLAVDSPGYIKWNSDTGESISTSMENNFVTSMDISSDGTLIAVGTTSNVAVEVHNYADSSLIWERDDNYGNNNSIKGEVTDIKWSPDNKLLAWTSPGDGFVLWNYLDDNLEYVDLRAEGGKLDWSPDGKLLAISNNKTITIISIENQKTITNLTGWDEPISSLSWSPDGKKIVGGDCDGRFIVFDSKESWNLIYNSNMTLSTVDDIVINNMIHDLDWSSDSSKLAVSSFVYPITIWNTNEWTKKSIDLEAKASGLLYLEWAPKGNKLVIANYNFINVYNIKNPTNVVFTYIAIGGTSLVGVGAIGYYIRKK